MTGKEKKAKMVEIKDKIDELEKELETIRKEEVSEWDFWKWGKDCHQHLTTINYPVSVEGLLNNKIRFLLTLVKFKYCYDLEYKPVWNANASNYVIFFDHSKNKFVVSDYTFFDNMLTIYFSSERIAQDCCDWLNAGCPEE